MNANLCAISICLLLSLGANGVRRMNNGVSSAMTDEE
ncbi:hypothetical protein T4C_5259 [Trichinella pseudospiralis]|uniref:Uncharacterized protein n=1 Tax=Trichinella pseudospiralis TaxID=6337 RepID=A0A0V1GQM5_TRIPS|nr:hypothetical protein T4C_5259 [Trichinella pseudospiralis]